jgi:hypothetical protein
VLDVIRRAALSRRQRLSPAARPPLPASTSARRSCGLESSTTALRWSAGMTRRGSDLALTRSQASACWKRLPAKPIWGDPRRDRALVAAVGTHQVKDSRLLSPLEHVGDPPPIGGPDGYPCVAAAGQATGGAAVRCHHPHGRELRQGVFATEDQALSVRRPVGGRVTGDRKSQLTPCGLAVPRKRGLDYREL